MKVKYLILISVYILIKTVKYKLFCCKILNSVKALKSIYFAI